MTVTIHYPFHPQHGLTLDVVRPPTARRSQLRLLTPDGGEIEVPGWMLEAKAAETRLKPDVEIGGMACVRAVELLRLALDERSEAGPASSRAASEDMPQPTGYRGAQPRSEPCSNTSISSSPRRSETSRPTA